MIIPLKKDQFLFTTPEDYAMATEARKAKPGTVAWGWNKPLIFTFIKVEAK